MDWLNFLNQNSGAIQAISVIVLVFLTGYYAIQTRKTVKEMVNTRKNEQLPKVILVGGKHCIGSNCNLEFILCNVGRGPAFDIKATVKTKEKDFGINKWSEDLAFSKPRDMIYVLPNKDVSLGRRLGLAKYIKVSGKYEMIISYQDIFGDKISTTQKFISWSTDKKDTDRVIRTVPGTIFLRRE